jgi:hypothetical protein
MSNNRAVIKLMYSKLKTLLLLPDNAEIVDVITDHWESGVFLVKVESPDLRPLSEGEFMPIVTPRYETEYTTHEKIIFTGWGD